ncbi:MAG TPA: hypothetical protein VMH00_05190 [Candidatus Limnocylindrales bacterium]|nr:hypothetical protein [Candidatus Limnocylindrales bacterium]
MFGRLHIMGGVRALCFALIAFLALGWSRPAAAQDTWQGTVNSSWSVAGNWDKGVPTGATPIIIPNGTPLVLGDTSITNRQQLSIGTTGTGSTAELDIASTTTITNTGPDGGINNAGVLNNAGAVILQVGTSLDQEATMTNSGLLQIDAGADITNYGAQFENAASGTLTDNGSFIGKVGNVIDNYGAITTGVGATFSSAGTLENHAGSSIVSYGNLENAVLLSNDTGASLTTYGELDNDKNLVNGGSFEIKSGGLLFSGFGTVDNSGTFQNDAGGAITNYGTIVNDPGATFTNNGAYLGKGGSQILNFGNFTVGSTGSDFENAGSISNDGIVKIVAGATLNNAVDASYLQTSGHTIVDGTMNSATPVQIFGGTLSGTGNIVGGLLNGSLAAVSSGTVQPGDNGEPGTLVVTGYEQESGATFDELIGSSGNGLLVAVGGGIQLDDGALLDIDLLDGFTPTDGEQFDIMAAILITGEFANAPTTGFEMDGFDWTIEYDPGEIVLDAVGPASGGGGGGGTTTPEPSGVLLLAMGVAALGFASQRKRAAAAA